MLGLPKGDRAFTASLKIVLSLCRRTRVRRTGWASSSLILKTMRVSHTSPSKHTPCQGKPQVHCVTEHRTVAYCTALPKANLPHRPDGPVPISSVQKGTAQSYPLPYRARLNANLPCTAGRKAKSHSPSKRVRLNARPVPMHGKREPTG